MNLENEFIDHLHGGFSGVTAHRNAASRPVHVWRPSTPAGLAEIMTDVNLRGTVAS
jgi:hypothetical protein